MQGQTGAGQRYVLGNHAEELARLDLQAAAIERPTRLLLQAAGLTAGMRVLDLGTGLGHVARLAAELVGPTGSVLGIDQSADVLAVARERTQQAGMVQVTFADGNALEWRATAPFDAIVGRLFLFHVPDPVAAVRHHRQNLRTKPRPGDHRAWPGNQRRARSHDTRAAPCGSKSKRGSRDTPTDGRGSVGACTGLSSARLQPGAPCV